MYEIAVCYMILVCLENHTCYIAQSAGAVEYTNCFSADG